MVWWIYLQKVIFFFSWEIRKLIQGFWRRRKANTVSGVEVFFLSVSLGIPWNRRCSWADFMLESCPKYTLTEGLCERTRSCLLPHTCHHTHSQVLNCLRRLHKALSSLFLKCSLVKMNTDSSAYLQYILRRGKKAYLIFGWNCISKL